MEKQIIAMFEMSFNREPGSLSRETKIREDLGGSSLLMVATIANVEEEFDVTFPLTEASKCLTIGEFIDKVEELAK